MLVVWLPWTCQSQRGPGSDQEQLWWRPWKADCRHVKHSKKECQSQAQTSHCYWWRKDSFPCNQDYFSNQVLLAYGVNKTSLVEREEGSRSLPGTGLQTFCCMYQTWWKVTELSWPALLPQLSPPKSVAVWCLQLKDMTDQDLELAVQLIPNLRDTGRRKPYSMLDWNSEQEKISLCCRKH